jgi:hypothetical protein
MHHQAREMIKELTLAYIAKGYSPNTAVNNAIEAAKLISAFLHGDDKRMRDEHRKFDFNNPTPD